MNPAWIMAFIALAGATTGMLAWLARWGWKVASRVTRFLDDYFGEPAHDGMEAKPGVMSRLQKTESMVAAISAEVHLNSGHSMRDVVQRTSADVTKVQTQVKELAHRVEQINDERGGR